MKEFVCDAVLLDMDGTLVDSTDVVVRQWRRWADRHGIPLEQILSNSHGVLTIDTMRRVAPNLATAEEAEALCVDLTALLQSGGGQEAAS